MRAALALLITGGVALAAGFLGFQAGVVSNIGAAGGTVVMGGGFHFFGLFLFLGFLFFSFMALAAIIGGRRHRHGPWGMRHGMSGGFGPGGMGPGGPSAGDPFAPQGHWADTRRAWVAEVHRSLHEEEAKTSSPAGSGTGHVGRQGRLTREPMTPGGYPRPASPSPGVGMRTILVVEDEPRIAGLVRDYLEQAGFGVLTAGDGSVRRPGADPAPRRTCARPGSPGHGRPRRHPLAPRGTRTCRS